MIGSGGLLARSGLRRSVRAAEGTGALEVLAALTVFLIALHLTAPSFVRWRGRQQLRGAVQGLVLAALRLQATAVATGRGHGLVFDVGSDTLAWRWAADGDGDGLRRGDLDTGTDEFLGPVVGLSREYADLLPGRPAGVPPVSGGAEGTGGVAFGSAALLAFSPDGSSSSGTLYLQNRWGDAAALRVYGPTGRFTLWWWEAGSGSWRILDRSPGL